MDNMTSKQRAQLRSLASTEDTIMQIGKNGITETLIATVSDALEARELIKLRVLENSGMTVREAAEELAAATNAEVAQLHLERRQGRHRQGHDVHVCFVAFAFAQEPYERGAGIAGPSLHVRL